MNPFTLLLTCAAGWMNRNQPSVIEYLQETLSLPSQVTIQTEPIDSLLAENLANQTF
jgi:hypothetical protein